MHNTAKLLVLHTVVLPCFPFAKTIPPTNFSASTDFTGFHLESPGKGSGLARSPLLRPGPLHLILRAAGGLGPGRGSQRRAPRAPRGAGAGAGRGGWGCAEHGAAEGGGLARGGVQLGHHEVSGETREI